MEMANFSQRVATQFSALSNPSRNGFVAEALVFLYLKQSPVIRAVEFAPIDGAVYLKWETVGQIPQLYSKRIDIARRDGSSTSCVNFDVKTRRLVQQPERPGRPCGLLWRGSPPTDVQRENCAFIIVIFASALGASREWAAIVPTHLFDGLLCKPQAAYNDVYASSSVDLALYPYVFPLDQISQAVQNVANAARQGQVYTNPWSDIQIPSWVPRPSSSKLVVSPSRSALEQVRISQKCLEWIQKAVHASSGRFQYEINDVQPLLGDFVLIGPDGSRHLFEHKANQFSESEGEVSFILIYGNSVRNPFHPLRLWDFAFWHKTDCNVAYCIPRNRVPEYFYTEKSRTITVPRSEVSLWRLHLDEGSRWLDDMFERIILPYHGSPELSADLLAASLKNFDVAAEGLEDEQEEIIEDSDLITDDIVRAARSVRGHGLHGLVCHLQDFCAQAGEGIVLPLWRHCPWGDYVFCRWSWTPSEKLAYRQTGKLPINLVDRRIRPQATICLLLVLCAVYNETDAGAIFAPPATFQYGSSDQRDDYFLTRERPFVLLADPSPEAVTSGPVSVPHPYLMVASEHLQRPILKTFERAHTLRHWLKGCRDPFTFVLPVRTIHQNLMDLLSSHDAQVSCNKYLPPIWNTAYRICLRDIWQAQAQAAEEDAYMTLNLLGKGRAKYTHLIKLTPGT